MEFLPKNKTQKGEMQSQGHSELQQGMFGVAEQQKKKNSRNMMLGCICFLVLIIVMYMAMFPLPIYEDYEAAVRNGAETIDIWGDAEALQKKHLEMIELTQRLYEKRRDEILEEVTDPNSSVGIAVHNKCLEILAEEYSGYTMGNISWDIPEKNYTLSAEEADMILYLYSCQFDWDFINGQPTNYIKWLYGIDSASPYEMKAMGKSFSLSGHGGYYMSQDKLNEARSKARKEASKAYWKARVSNSGMTLATALMHPFIDVAYAADDSLTPREAYSEAYQNCLDDYAAQYGASALDTIIYTNVSDQITGKISFTVCAKPYFESDPIKVEDFEGSKAEEEAKKGSADPMHSRVVCLDYTETQTRKGAEIAWNTSYSYDKKGNIISEYTYPIDWERIVDSQTYVIILCYAVIPSVDFTATADINASGMSAAIQSGFQRANIGNEVGTE